MHCRCATDSNGDGEINITDLLAIIGDWGQDHSAADVNGDGTVDVGDLLDTIGSWGWYC